MRSKQKEQDTYSRDRTMAIYGVNPVLEALRAAQRPIQEISIAESVRDARLSEIVQHAREQNIPIHRSPRKVLDRMADNAVHQGVIARVAGARYADAEELLESIALRVGQSPEPLLIILDGVEDPHNLGAVLRTAECSGVDAVFVPERRAVGLTDAVAKASAGAIEHVPVSRVTNLSRLIDQLKERNVWVVGTAADAPAAYTDWDWTRPSAVVLGGEGSGLHRLVRENCDVLVRIPVRGEMQS